MPSDVRTGATLGYVAAWAAVAAAFSLAMNATGVLPLQRAIVAGTLCTLPAAALGVPVVALCHRFPFQRGRLLSTLQWHVLGGIAFSALWAITILGALRIWATPSDASSFLAQGLAWQFLTGLLTYSVIAGVASTRVAFLRQEAQVRLTARAETLKMRAELEALRARLDPHFLFNVLQTIGALVEHNPRETHRALELLASLLKRRLVAARANDDDASLREEMEDVREYCALERLRLGDRLEVVEEIEAPCMMLMLPRFTLQPLVENAIRHGIARQMTPGRLTLRAAVHDNCWMLEVSDNAGGANQLALDSASGLGLSVIKERMQLRFSGASVVTINTAPGSGFSVSLKLPLQSHDDMDDDRIGSGHA